MQRAIIMCMLNIWVAIPTQQSGWGRAYHRGKSGPALRRAPGSAPAFATPAGPSMPPLAANDVQTLYAYFQKMSKRYLPNLQGSLSKQHPSFCIESANNHVEEMAKQTRC